MPWIRAAATAARSSESLNAVGLVSRYGSKSSAYSSHAASRAARPTLSTSRSGSAPTSGSAFPGGITSVLAPSCAPASITCATSSNSSGTISSPPSPRPSAASASRKSRACAAIRSACARQSPPLSPAVAAGAGFAGSATVAGLADPSVRPGLAGSWGLAGAPGLAGSAGLAGLAARPAARPGSDIEGPPSLERPPQRHLVGILQVASDRQPAGRPGYPEAERLHQPGQIGRCGLALEIRIGGQDHLADIAVCEPGHQLGDPQVLGSDAVHGADRAAEHVIPAAKLADLLDRRHVLGLLHYADHRRVPAHVQADSALVILGDVAAGAAEFHLLGHLDERRREPADVLRADRQQVKRDPLRALRADTRKLAKLVDQVLDDSFVHLSLRPIRPRPTRPRPIRPRLTRPRRPAAVTPAATCQAPAAGLKHPAAQAVRAARGSQADQAGRAPRRPRFLPRPRSRLPADPSSRPEHRQARGTRRGRRRAPGRPPWTRSPQDRQARWRRSRSTGRPPRPGR